MNTTENKPTSPTETEYPTTRYTPEILKNDLIVLPRLDQVKETDTDSKVTEQDLLQINTCLFAIHQALPHVRSVDSLCKLSLTASKLIDQRRKCLKLKSGAGDGEVGKGGGNRTIEMI